MPPAVPDSLARLLSLLRGAFTAPSFDTFSWLVCGFIGRIGEHTITGIWQAARLAGRVHTPAPTTSSPAGWSPDRLGLLVAEFVVGRFLDPDEPLRIAVDDTLFPRSGPRVFAAGFHFDQDSRGGRLVRFGNLFVYLGIVLELPGLGERAVCLPLLFRLWRKAPDGAPSSGPRSSSATSSWT